MNNLLPNNDFTKRRIRTSAVYARTDLPIEELFAILKDPGVELKRSKKALTRRVDNWVIKESRGPLMRELVKHTLSRERYRRAWYAAHYLLAKGIRVPKPIAYIEKSLLGCIAGTVNVTEHLKGHRSVQQFLHALVNQGAGKETITRFLDALADAVLALSTSGAYHADLAGKNIYTSDGETFYFIDLDAVVLGTPYTQDLRLRNHVQLYDAFCDQLNDALLVPFIQRMLPNDVDSRMWLPAMRTAQAERRRFVRKQWGPHQKMPEI